MSGNQLWSLPFKKLLPEIFILSLLFCLLIGGTMLIRHISIPARNELKTLLDSNINSPSSVTSNDQTVPLYSGQEVSGHYQQNNYTRVWVSNEWKLKPVGYSWINRIKTSYKEGLNPADYHLQQIEDLLTLITEKPDEEMDRVRYSLLELLLTDAFVTYAGHQYAGRVHTLNENTEWAKHIEEINPSDSLKYIDEGSDINAIIQPFVCPHKQYTLLQKKLTVYYEDSSTFLTGSAGNAKAINSIILNLERWRWMSRQMPDRYIMANIANFSLTVRDQNKDTLTMKIIVGKTRQPTPLLQAKLYYLVLNPWWEIPAEITRKEMIPELIKDRSYLEQNHIGIFESNGIREIAPDSINWDAITSYYFPYKLRQRPGSWNALGEVKFIFPNNQDVYFHDTPNRELFYRSTRTFSHGCIRVEKPLELASLLLKKDTGWVRNQLDSKKTILLEIRPAPMVYICYWTAWIDEGNQLRTAPDIYQYDQKLEKLLNAPNTGT